MGEYNLSGVFNCLKDFFKVDSLTMTCGLIYIAYILFLLLYFLIKAVLCYARKRIRHKKELQKEDKQEE